MTQLLNAPKAKTLSLVDDFYCTGWILIKFLSADSFSSALLGVSSREEGEGEELFDKFFVAFVFQLKAGILALNQVVCREASTWT